MRKKKVEVKKSNKRKSILKIHEILLLNFSKKNDKIKVVNNKIKALKKELSKTNDDISYKHLNNENDDKLKCNKKYIEKNIIELEDSKKIINSNDEEMDYLLEAMPIITEYIKIEEQLNLLLLENGEIEDHISINEIVNKKHDLVNLYLTKFDKENTYNHYNLNVHIKEIICQTCNVHYDFEDGFLSCKECGHTLHGLHLPTELSYKELQEYDYKPRFSYCKQSHFDDWIKRFTSRENRVIPESIILKVILEAKKDRIIDLNDLTEKKVKLYLKKLGLNDYYDNVISIINRINKRDPFRLTPEIENKLKTMFQQIQEPFVKHKPASRKNFLSYSYTLHQFFKILNLPEFAEYFVLLKSNDKLRQQDDIFKEIVQDLSKTDTTINWVFNPTI